MTDIQGEVPEDRGAVLVVTLMPPDGQNATSFTESLLSAFIHDAQRSGALLRGQGPMFIPTSPMQVAANRSKAAKILLDDSEADWLLFIDSDMGFSPDAVDALLAAADPATRPIVGALCFGMRKEGLDSQGGFRTVPFPTVYDFRPPGEEDPGFVPRYNYAPDAVVQCAATGAAFLLVHRSALQTMRESLGDTWFDRAKLSADSEAMGEDLSFCLRAGGLGIPIFVHTGVRTTHLKPVWVGEDFYHGARVLALLEREEGPDA